MPKYIFTKLTDIMPIGSYKGRTINEILSIEPGYLDWLMKQKFTSFSTDLVQKMLNWKYYFNHLAK